MLRTVKKLQPWGNSFGIRLTKSEMENERINPNDEVELVILKKSNPAREVFGSLKGKIKKPREKAMKEIDIAFESRFD